ncbi:putative hydro-lyase [Azospirillum sp. ST 5-10]|uniref:putative hydro-lyase n=1 Tax=unclassified Azospirillum TaxID=2630922 RepID=UPI003F49EFFE
MQLQIDDYTPGLAERRRIRAGFHTGPTAGLAPGYVQCNLAILPADWAAEFLRFCQANPKPCPLLAVSEPGDPTLPTLGRDIDIRTDVPRYRVFRDGAFVDEPADIRALWRDDLVSFLIGCSFSFEEALLAERLPVRHIAQGSNVPMYRTTLPCTPAGRFHGGTVVSMRPMAPRDAIRAIQITSRFPSVHGAPVHFGNPEALGIADLDKPDFGDPVPVAPGEVPVFWACGVTPQVAIANARPPIAITHSPGAMLVTDLLNAQLSAL